MVLCECYVIVSLKRRKILTDMQLKLCRFTTGVLVVILCSLQGATAQKATVVKFDALQKILNKKSDQIQVINFCVK